MFMLNGNHESLNIAGNFRRAPAPRAASTWAATHAFSGPGGAGGHRQ